MSTGKKNLKLLMLDQVRKENDASLTTGFYPARPSDVMHRVLTILEVLGDRFTLPAEINAPIIDRALLPPLLSSS